jgi:beta-phosphoglucomutase-like phosphatase (HAD superfamily)
MSLGALIFDVDGTVADTQEAHRQAFNQAFCAFGLDWSWSPERYRGLLQVTGVKAAKAAGLFTLVTPSPWTQSEDFSAADLVLPSLADPEKPFDAADELRFGARDVGLAELAGVHAARVWA